MRLLYEMLGGRRGIGTVTTRLPTDRPRHRAPRGRRPRRFPAPESGQRDDWNGCWGGRRRPRECMTAPLRGRVGAVTGLADRCRHRRAPASARSLFTDLKAQKWAKGGNMTCGVAPAITLSPKIFQAVRCHTGVVGRTDGESSPLTGQPRCQEPSVTRWTAGRRAVAGCTHGRDGREPGRRGRARR